MTRRRSFNAEYAHEAVRLLDSSGRPWFNLAREFDVRRDPPYRRKGQLRKRGDEVFPVSLLV